MREFKDIITRVAKVASSYISGVGPVVAEIIDYGSNLFEQEKIKNFMNSVENLLQRHESELEKIKSDEFGYFYFLKATRRWIEETENKKILYFANCVENGYILDISSTKKNLFLNELTKLSVEHLTLLDYLSKYHNKEKVKSNNMVKVEKVFGGTEAMFSAIVRGLPQYKKEKDLLANLIRVLEQDGLIYSFTLDTTYDKDKTESKWTTKLGDEFLDYIKDKNNG